MVAQVQPGVLLAALVILQALSAHSLAQSVQQVLSLQFQVVHPAPPVCQELPVGTARQAAICVLLATLAKLFPQLLVLPQLATPVWQVLLAP